MDNNPLGEFLRARRALLDPAAFALPPGTGARRVTGLRRDEVAFLAGVSIDYYARLEQGRDRHPSESVLSALAQVLDLDRSTTPAPGATGTGASTAAEIRGNGQPRPGSIAGHLARPSGRDHRALPRRPGRQ